MSSAYIEAYLYDGGRVYVNSSGEYSSSTATVILSDLFEYLTRISTLSHPDEYLSLTADELVPNLNSEYNITLIDEKMSKEEAVEYIKATHHGNRVSVDTKTDDVEGDNMIVLLVEILGHTAKVLGGGVTTEDLYWDISNEVLSKIDGEEYYPLNNLSKDLFKVLDSE